LKGTTVKLYVGNLSFGATEGDVQQAFNAFGTVDSVAIITDKFSGRSRGFCFVEMPIQSEAEAAIQAMNGADFQGRALVVNIARPRENRGRSFGGDNRDNRGFRGGGDRNRDGQRGRRDNYRNDY
jgi:RNA recognition motif-containing protein